MSNYFSKESREKVWLLQAQWLRKVDDYHAMTVNIVIPDYVAVFVDVYAHVYCDEEDATQVYIQNIYAILFYKNDPKSNMSLLKTAIVDLKQTKIIVQNRLYQEMDKDTYFRVTVLDTEIRRN